MTIVFPVCRKDSPELLRLLVWIKKLGPCKNHRALIVSDADTPYRDCLDAQQLAGELFSECRMVATKEHVEGWPQGGNALFKLACESVDEPWFWCESDCVPLKAGWADALAAEYDQCGKPFMGPVIATNNPKFPALYLNGTSVYSANALRTFAVFCDGDKAWDVASAGAVVPQAFDTRLIQHFWGQPNLAPTFVARKTAQSPVNAFSLADLRKEAVIFHRCKDGSLIELLGGDPSPSSNMVVVMPFCNKDAALMLKMLRWCQELCGRIDFDVVVSYEHGTTIQNVRPILQIANAIFRKVFTNEYPHPPMQFLPQTWAFRMAAEFILLKVKRPFLWMEYDAIPLTNDWVDKLQKAYSQCGKRFMGPVVEIMGHMNGTGIYPSDTLLRIPNALNNGRNAWDVAMRGEMIHDCHDCGNIFQHCWGIERNRTHAFLGMPASFKSMVDVNRWLLPSAVVFHRCKDGTLIDRLRELRKRPR